MLGDVRQGGVSQYGVRVVTDSYSTDTECMMVY